MDPFRLVFLCNLNFLRTCSTFVFPLVEVSESFWKLFYDAQYSQRQYAYDMICSDAFYENCQVFVVSGRKCF